MTTPEQVERPVPRELWEIEDVTRLAGFLVLGLVLTAAGTFRAAEEVRLAQQIGDINLAVVGVIVAAIGNVRWFLRGRYAVGVRRASIVAQRRALLLPESSPVGEAALSSVPSPRPLAGPGLTRYHRPDCALTAGRGWRPTDLEEHLAEGRKPCGVCRP